MDGDLTAADGTNVPKNVPREVHAPRQEPVELDERGAVGELAVYGQTLIESREDGSARVLLVFGDLDGQSARVVMAHCMSTGADGRPLTLDLSGLSLLDRPTMQLLLTQQRAIQRRGTTVVIRIAAHQAPLVA